MAPGCEVTLVSACELTMALSCEVTLAPSCEVTLAPVCLSEPHWSTPVRQYLLPILPHDFLDHSATVFLSMSLNWFGLV